MSQTKVTDALRNVTSVDATKLTGTIADARIPSSAVTQHVTATDTTSIENDISTLALQSAINSNMTAHSLVNNYIEQFEDSASITGLTNVARVSGDEFVASVYQLNTVVIPSSSANWAGSTGNFTFTSGGADQTASNIGIYGPSAGFAGDFDVQADISWTGGSSGNLAVYATSEQSSYYNSDMATRNITNSYGMDAWYPGNSANQVHYGNVVQGSTYTRPASGDTMKFTRRSGVIKAYLRGVLVHTYSQNYSGNMKSSLSGQDASNDTQNISWTDVTTANNATGSFTSTTITPPDSASRSSLGLCLLYKNTVGTNTLNTDIVASVSANNGTNYTPCVLAAQGAFSAGINIAIAPAVSVTTGTQLKYKIEFANQALASKEGRVYGVALQY